MSECDSSCSGCGQPYEIKPENLDFRGGKVVYYKCPGCGQKTRIKWDIVGHLKKESGSLIEAPKKESAKEKEAPEKPEKESVEASEDNSILGAVAAVIAILISIAGIVYLWWKNRKEGGTF